MKMEEQLRSPLTNITTALADRVVLEWRWQAYWKVGAYLQHNDRSILTTRYFLLPGI